jgi:hypothetical protein
VDLQTTSPDGGLAKIGLLRQLVRDVAHEEALLDGAIHAASLEAERRGIRPAALGFADHSGLLHCLQHLSPPHQRVFGILVRVVSARQLWQTRD